MLKTHANYKLNTNIGTHTKTRKYNTVTQKKHMQNRNWKVSLGTVWIA